MKSNNGDGSINFLFSPLCMYMLCLFVRRHEINIEALTAKKLFELFVDSTLVSTFVWKFHSKSPFYYFRFVFFGRCVLYVLRFLQIRLTCTFVSGRRSCNSNSNLNKKKTTTGDSDELSKWWRVRCMKWKCEKYFKFRYISTTSEQHKNQMPVFAFFEYFLRVLTFKPIFFS